MANGKFEELRKFQQIVNEGKIQFEEGVAERIADKLKAIRSGKPAPKPQATRDETVKAALEMASRLVNSLSMEELKRDPAENLNAIVDASIDATFKRIGTQRVGAEKITAEGIKPFLMVRVKPILAQRMAKKEKEAQAAKTSTVPQGSYEPAAARAPTQPAVGQQPDLMQGLSKDLEGLSQAKESMSKILAMLKKTGQKELAAKLEPYVDEVESMGYAPIEEANLPAGKESEGTAQKSFQGVPQGSKPQAGRIKRNADIVSREVEKTGTISTPEAGKAAKDLQQSVGKLVKTAEPAAETAKPSRVEDVKVEDTRSIKGFDLFKLDDRLRETDKPEQLTLGHLLASGKLNKDNNRVKGFLKKVKEKFLSAEAPQQATVQGATPPAAATPSGKLVRVKKPAEPPPQTQAQSAAQPVTPPPAAPAEPATQAQAQPAAAAPAPPPVSNVTQAQSAPTPPAAPVKPSAPELTDVEKNELSDMWGGLNDLTSTLKGKVNTKPINAFLNILDDYLEKAGATPKGFRGGLNLAERKILKAFKQALLNENRRKESMATLKISKTDMGKLIAESLGEMFLEEELAEGFMEEACKAEGFGEDKMVELEEIFGLGKKKEKQKAWIDQHEAFMQAQKRKQAIARAEAALAKQNVGVPAKEQPPHPMASRLEEVIEGTINEELYGEDINTVIEGLLGTKKS